MSWLAILIVIAIIAVMAVIIVGVSVTTWGDVERRKAAAQGPISEELANELRNEIAGLKIEMAAIKENLISINKMMQDVG